MPILGAHVSAAAGLWKCFGRAKKIGAKTIQIFGSSPQQWKTKIPTEAEIKKFKKIHKESGIDPVFLHASYLVNLASPDNRIRYGSIKILSDHLSIAELLGIKGLIFHIGSATGGIKKSDAMKKVIKGIKMVLKEVPGKSQLIMENTAGGGNKIGDEMRELGEIYQGVKSERLKVCIDTAHGLEAGVFKTFSKTELDKFVNKCKKEFGWKNVVALHINDSKTKYKSHHDRHANIGEGEIGIKGFKNLVVNKFFNKLPWILEVPGFDNKGPDKRNIEILKGLINKS